MYSGVVLFRCLIVHPSAVVVLHDGVTLIVDN